MSVLPTIAIVGATGAVGREALSILAERAHPSDRVLAFASERSSGRTIDYADGVLPVRTLTKGALCTADIAIFASSAEVSREYVPEAAASGVVCIDNSSAFRADPRARLVIPEVNGHELDRLPESRIFANPNCSTILLLVALEPLRRAFGIERVIVSTYQAVSGAGLAGMEELRSQARAYPDDPAPEPRVFPQSCLFNCFVHESPLDPLTGFNGEEQKIVSETGRIWGLDGPAPVVPTCVRVPVLRAHCESVFVRLEHAATLEEVRTMFASAPGLALDDGSDSVTPRRASGADDILIGHLRSAGPVGEPNREFAFWLSGDQLRKGAALNALQIAERVMAQPMSV